LEIHEVRLDGMPLRRALISPGARVIALDRADRPDWEEVEVDLRLHTPTELRAGTWQEIRCYSSLFEGRTNSRSITQLGRASDDVWSGTVRAHHDDHHRRIELDALITATIQDEPGRIIGRATEAWTIDLEARTPARRNTVQTIRADFAAPDRPFLNPYREDPWMIEASGEEPVLYINTGFEGLDRLLRSNDRTTRDMVGAQISSDVWVALFNAAAAAVETDVDDQPIWPGGWRSSVLQRLLPDLFPEHSLDDALIEIHARREQGEGADLQARLLHAAGRQARLPKRLDVHIRNLAKKENS